jgi:hypothetical protein
MTIPNWSIATNPSGALGFLPFSQSTREKPELITGSPSSEICRFQGGWILTTIAKTVVNPA